jgi:hypothetical protein
VAPQLPRITVIGTGYLGATHAAAMAELGFEVLGMDVVPEKIELLRRGEVPMYEPGLAELLRRHVAGIAGSTGRLRFTLDMAEVADFGDVHFVCVNTPQKHGEFACDMSYVDAAFDALAPLLHRPCLVVGKSTVPVGTAATEELVFRGVLFAAWLQHGLAEAWIVSSVTFGLWHVSPTVNLVRANRPDAGAARVAGAVAVAVAATTAAGASLVLLRYLTGSLLAPWALHAALNSVATMAAARAHHTLQAQESG